MNLTNEEWRMLADLDKAPVPVDSADAAFLRKQRENRYPLTDREAERLRVIHGKYVRREEANCPTPVTNP